MKTQEVVGFSQTFESVCACLRCFASSECRIPLQNDVLAQGGLDDVGRFGKF